LKKSLIILFSTILNSILAQKSNFEANKDSKIFKKHIQIYSEKNQYDSLNKYCDLYINHALSLNDDETILDAYTLKASAKRRQTDWIDLIKTGQEAIKKIDSLKIKVNALQKSLIIEEMIYGFIFLNDVENFDFFSNTTITSLKKENKNGQNNSGISRFYLARGRAYGYFKQIKKGNQYLDSSLHFINKTNNILQKHFILNDYISNNIQLGNYKESLPLALTCLEFFKKNPNNHGLMEIQMLLAKIHLGLKNYEKAIEFGKMPFGKIENPRIYYRNYEILYQAYKAKNMNAEALFAYEKYIEYHEKIFNEKMATDKIAFEKRTAEEKSINLVNQEKIEVEYQKRFRNYLIIGAVLLSIFTIGLIFNRKLLKKQKKEIENQNIMIEELNQNLEQKVINRTTELQTALNEIKDAMQRGQSIERKRMAADLHDNLGSLLTAINISLENINSNSLSEKEKKIYKNIVWMTENAYSEVRILSHNLMPEELEKEGLENALKRMIQKINLNQKLNFELIISELQNNSKTIELNIYAICLEMVQNIIKHSRATKATISLFEKGNHLWLEVIDNGRGIDPTKEKGIGLKNIKNRLESLDGELFIDSEDGKGTKMVVSVPLEIRLISNTQ
jgi:two-component system, NarL family, sensor histidine kinase FusK